MAAPPTVLDLKLAFLHEQIQALMQSLRIPASYQPVSEDSALREKSIDMALTKLNESIKKHSKLAYPVQARRHVAEQIDTLYWQAGERDIVTGNWDGLHIGDDLSTSESIAHLPNDWDPDNDEGEPASQESEMQSQYSELAARVKDLNALRQELRQRVAGYKALKELLAPFENATETVQQNLVVRDGELEKELERMRLLIARVRGRVEGLPTMGEGGDQGSEQGDEMEVGIVNEEAKIKKLLGMP